jgi:ribosomal protein L16/L10AE
MRKQKGRLKLKKRVNITYPLTGKSNIAIYVNKTINLTLEQFKIIKLDLSRALQGLSQFNFTVKPNKPITLKGILVRMGKGKGKIKSYKVRLEIGTIVIIVKSTKINNLSPFFKKYPFFSIKKN